MPSRRSASSSNGARHDESDGGDHQAEEEEGDEDLGEQNEADPSSDQKSDDDESNTDDGDRKRKADDTKKGKANWTASEDEVLLKAVIEDQQNREAEGQEDEEEDWDEIAQSLPGKTPVQCLKRYMLLNQSGGDDDDSAPVSKKARRASKAKQKEEAVDPFNWSKEDIDLLKKLVEQYKDSKCGQFSRDMRHARPGASLLDGIFLTLLHLPINSCTPME
jgi:hypothetical protein